MALLHKIVVGLLPSAQRYIKILSLDRGGNNLTPQIYHRKNFMANLLLVLNPPCFLSTSLGILTNHKHWVSDTKFSVTELLKSWILTLILSLSIDQRFVHPLILPYHWSKVLAFQQCLKLLVKSQDLQSSSSTSHSLPHSSMPNLLIYMQF